MNRRFERITAAVALAGAAGMVGAALAFAAGARINTTRSIPVGLYWASSAAVEKGTYVLFCPPQAQVFHEARARGYIGAGFCPGGYGYMMKRVLAAQDDDVAVSDEGVRVNGVLLPLSAPRAVDAGGRPLPRFQADRYTLGAAELLLMSDVSGTSFDGRYFGPLHRSQIQTVVSPLITW
ncbi:MAG: conjugative transfer signal peptidase TraF [Proteobacteria bacterium]|nr:conjugative transfer signal peptidase TraF [Pseudomonadota bacterium]MBS0551284.1 conjugative transfer signal peptidase TraF [Pseudomonadota bacterium]